MGDWIPDHRCDCSVRDDGDRGFIGFEDNGDVPVSPVAHARVLYQCGAVQRGAAGVPERECSGRDDLTS